MCSLIVIILDEPCEIGIELIDRPVDFRPEGDLVELFQNCSVQPFTGAVGPRMPHFSQPVPDDKSAE